MQANTYNKEVIWNKIKYRKKDRKRKVEREGEREKGCVNHKYSENIFWKHFSIHN